ncbi:MAG: thioredoxin family protein [Bdellovibrionota bacterium]
MGLLLFLSAFFPSFINACPVSHEAYRQAERAWNTRGNSGTHRYESANFIVLADSDAFAKAVAEEAERHYAGQARYWFGKTYPRLWRRVEIRTLKADKDRTSGLTKFSFDRGEVFGWEMVVRGTEESILAEVVPHEVSHIIMALAFRRPLPRALDEGIATLWEPQDAHGFYFTRLKNESQMRSLSRLLRHAEYPRDMEALYDLYAYGMKLADYLLRYDDPKNSSALLPASYPSQSRFRLLNLIKEAHRRGWEAAFEYVYGKSLSSIQREFETYAYSENVSGNSDAQNQWQPVTADYLIQLLVNRLPRPLVERKRWIPDRRYNVEQVSRDKEPVEIPSAQKSEPPANPVRIVYFGATWCGPCLQLKPRLLRLKSLGYPIEIYDVDEHPELATKYGARDLPTTYFFGRTEQIASRYKVEVRKLGDESFVAAIGLTTAVDKLTYEFYERTQ